MPGNHSISVRIQRGAPLGDPASRTDGYLSYAFDVDWAGSGKPSAWNAADEHVRDAMVEQLVRIRSGVFTVDDIRRLGAAIGSLIRPRDEPNLSRMLPPYSNDSPDLELFFDSATKQLATDLPWEMVPVDSAATAGRPLREVVLASLAARPIVRVVQGMASLSGNPPGRLRALLCVAVPTEPAPGVPAEPLDPIPVDPFRSALGRAFAPYGALDVQWVPLAPDAVLVGNLTAIIHAQRPHLFVLVAHGSSGGATGGVPSVRLSDAWCPVQVLAKALREKDQPVMSIWICCDQARTPQSGGQSAALAAIAAGVAEVVAMQGNVQQPVAERFVKCFLDHLLAGMSTPMAARCGRIEVANREHAFLPAVFRSEAWTEAGSVVSQKAAAYRAALLRLRGQLPKPFTHQRRRTLEDELAKRCADSGLLVVTGGPQAGKSHLVAAVVRHSLAAKRRWPRPAIMVDVRMLTPSTRTASGVLAAIRQRLSEIADMLPEDLKGGSQAASPARVLSFVDDCGIVLILDHVPAEPASSESALWRELAESAAGMSRSLIVAVTTGKWQPAPADTVELLVTSFSQQETKTYVEHRIGSLAPRWLELYQRTGGQPGWLDMVRRRVEEAGTAIDLDEILDPERQKFAQYMLKGLSAADMAAAQCLARLAQPANRRLALELLIPQGGTEEGPWAPRDSVARLVRLGVLAERLDSRGTRLIQMPDVQRDAALLLEPPADASAERVCEHFFHRVAGDQTTIPRAYNDPGGPAVLWAAQSAFIELAQQHAQGGEDHLAKAAWKRAIAIPTPVDTGGAASRDLLDLYSRLTNDNVPESVRVQALTRGAMLARAIGDEGLTRSWLAMLEGMKMSDDKRAEFLVTRARFLKDTEQHAALPQIHTDLSGALAAAERAAGSGADTRSLQVEILQARMDTRMFLEGATPAQVADDFARLQSLEPSSEQIGGALATFAERAQKPGASGEVDWAAVEDHATRAYRLVEHSADHRFRGFAAYRYGRYLEEGPKQLADAVRKYVEAEQEARLAGEPRRQANAAYRRLRLQWGVLKEVKGQVAADAVDELIALLFRQPHQDSLTLRVAQRLLLFRASLAERDGAGPPLGLLKRACRTGAELPGGSTNDNRRLAESFVRYLGKLRGMGYFADAQLIVNEYRDALRDRLGIDETVISGEGVAVKGRIAGQDEQQKRTDTRVAEGEGAPSGQISLEGGEKQRAAEAFKPLALDPWKVEAYLAQQYKIGSNEIS